MKRNFLIILTGILFLGLIFNQGCKKDEENKLPVVSAVLVEPGSVNPGATALVTVTATDPDGDALTYAYAPTGGSITGNTATVTWVAPTTAGSYSVIVTVSDGKGGQATGTGALTVNQPVTTITGSAKFPAGTSGDLSNSKVSIYTSWDNWYYNQPVKFVATSGAGSTVTFNMDNVAPGNYYLDIWKDNDNSGTWSSGDFVGWFGSGGLGSPSVTEFQIAQGETKNFSIDMYIIAKGSEIIKKN